MKFPRRSFLEFAGAAIAAPAISRLASAQTYPARPVRIIVGYPAGGVTDIFARLIGQSLSDRLGKQFVIENRPGASGTIAVDAVVRAPPDGYTLLLTAGNDALNELLYPVRFRYLRDIAPVANIAVTSLVMEVNPALPAKTVGDFIDYAKVNPGKINFASAGVGTGQHLCGELFKIVSGIGMLHVPYRGEAPAITDLLGGQVQVYFGFLPASIENIRAGRLRALAVTAPTRVEFLPDVPPLADSLPGFDAVFWFGIGAPRSTPPGIIEILNRETNTALADPGIKARLSDLGSVAAPGSTAEFAQLIAADTEKWTKVIRAANIKL